MCGINGIYSLKRIDKLSSRIREMNRSVMHRGPDAEGMEIFSDQVGFGHRRLAIIDLDSRAGQPMKSNSGATIIVFNGEIFNFREIRSSLEEEYDFNTNSDTEVLIAAYEVKGLDWLLEEINGMFAFALYDNLQDKLYLVRDRLGIKPLFYHYKDATLIFSSEIKGILRSGLVEAELNPKSIDDYLGYRYVREPDTFFKHIYQVKSGSYLFFSSKLRVLEKLYWDLPALNFESNYNETSIIEKSEYEIVKAVDRWLISDVKLGAYLSGGVDSSLTTAIISNSVGNNLDTYTIGFEQKGFNEFEFARKVASRYQTNHHEFSISMDEYFDEWYRLIDFKDEPLAVPNEIPLAVMTTKLSSDITVVISGEGADELFGGYGRIFRSAFDYSNHFDGEIPFYNYFINLYEYVPRQIRDTYLNVEENSRDYFDDLVSGEFGCHRNEESIFRFFHKYHIKGLLKRVDMATMQASIEGRPPFLDHKLIEFVYKEVPYSMKLRWKHSENGDKASQIFAKDYSEKLDIPKYILKEISKSLLPKEVISRRKVGFPVPLTQWMPEIIELATSELKTANWIRGSAVPELVRDIRSNDTIRAGQLLWMFINIEIFRKKYFTKKWTW